MNSTQLFEQLKAKNITIGVVSGELRVVDPERNLTGPLISALRQEKANLIRLLSREQLTTKSDFRYSEVSDRQLEALHIQYPDLQNLYIAAPMQTGMLFHGLLDGTGASYTTQAYFNLAGTLDVDAFRRAWQYVVDRHDILRTCFVGLDSDRIHQLVLTRASVPFVETDWRDLNPDVQLRQLEELRLADKARGFDFGQAPLMRIQLVRLTQDRYHFLWSHHHVLLDGWCGPIIIREVMTCYRAFVGKVAPSLPPVVPYEHYIGWLFTQDLDKARTFWRDYLAGVPARTALVVEKPLPDAASTGVQSVKRSLATPVGTALDGLARTTRCTMNVIVQAAWAFVLHRYCGEQDVVFGTTVSGRPAHLPGVEQMIGLFINTLPVRVKFSAETTLGELLKQVHANNIGRDEFAYLSLAEIQKLGEMPAGGSLFDSLLVFENFPNDEEAVAQVGQTIDLRAESAKTDERTNYALTLMAEQRLTLELELQYRAELFTADTAERLLGHLEQVLTDMAWGGAEQRVCDLSLLSPAEREQLLVTWNDTAADFPADVCVHALFEQQAERTPERVAVACDGRSLTYRQLNECANRLAHALIEHGVVPDALVGLCVERSPEMLVGILGILKAGGAYVPLDTTLPKSRLEGMLRECNAPVVVTQEALQPLLTATTQHKLLCLDVTDTSEQLATRSCANPSLAGFSASNLAYVIYTSGSTGRPKGVLVEHRSIVNLLDCWQQRWALDDAEENLPASFWTSFGFDVSVFEIFVPLTAGLSVHVVPESIRADPDAMLTWLVQQRIAFAYLPPHLVRMLKDIPDERLAGLQLKRVLIGVEPLPEEYLYRLCALLPALELVNGYGPTEATVFCTTYSTTSNLQRTMPIGKPLANTRIYVLDAARNPVPQGVQGEIFVGGAGLARGYLNQPELTEERFLADPFAGAPARMYRTGDLGHWLPDGNLEITGRMDAQVKLRGYRIELGEIESVLRRAPNVRDAVVLARSDGGDGQRLVAYVVASIAGTEPSRTLVDDCRQHLKMHLPDYMVPALFLVLSALPLTSSGKIDRDALPSPALDELPRQTYVEPKTDVERTLCEIWASVLRLERVGTADNFFEIGGDSILAIKVAMRAIKAGIGLTVRRLFDHQTIGEVALNLRDAAPLQWAQDAAVGAQPLLPIHHWFFEHATAGRDHHNQSVLLIPPAGFDESFLSQWVAALYARHDALRLRFLETEQGWHSEYVPLSSELVAATIQFVDMRGASPEQQQASLAEVGQRLQTSLSLADGRLMRAGYFKGDSESRLLLIVHHMVIDGVSWRIVLDDLELAYQQHARGEAIALASKTTSYQQWSEFLAAYPQRPDYAVERSYWLENHAQPVLPLPQDEPVVVEGRTIGVVDVELNTEQTTILLQQSGAAYRTQINELLLAALWLGVYRWSGQTALRVCLEGHGREELEESLDLSQTLGWFTTRFPLTLHAASTTLSDLIPAIKEQHRRVPNKGLGYGVLKYLLNETALQGDGGAHVSFNYLGQFDSTINLATTFQAAAEYVGENIGATERREALLDINGMVAGSRLELRIAYSRSQYRDDRMNELAAHLKGALLAVIAHCQEPDAGRYTPSDFPLAMLSQRQLDEWQQQYPAIETVYATVPMQQGMLFHSLLDQNKSLYVGQMGYTLAGPLHTGLLRDAWQMVIARHAVLRTVFVGLESAQIQQLVLRQVELPWVELDWRELAQAEQADRFAEYQECDKRAGFDVGEAPLMRMAVIRVDEERYRILWTFFMGLFDGWSLPIINDELFTCYRALRAAQVPPLPPPPPYHRYVAWLAAQDPSAAQTFWRDQLDGVSGATPLRIDTLPVEAGRRGGRVNHLRLSESLSAQLEELVRKTQTTMNVAMQAAWSYLLHRYSGESRVVFGATVSGRPAELAGVEQMLGLFINTLPVRVDFEPRQSVAQVLKNLNHGNSLRNDYSYLPLAKIQGLAGVPAGTGLFDTQLVFQNYPLEQVMAPQSDKAAELSVESVQVQEETNFTLGVVASFRGVLKAEIQYRAEQFADTTIQALIGHLEQILTGMARGGAEQAMQDLPLLSHAERDMLTFASNDTAAVYPHERCLHALFEAQAERTPQATALVCGEQVLSYRALNERANQLAHHLIEQGVGPDVPVGLCLQRSPDMVMGLLGILKAGGAYVPLDPAYPASRLDFMLRDSAAPIVVTQQQFRPLFGDNTMSALLCLDAPATRDQLNVRSHANPSVGDLDSEALAYVIYTSGSTGTPKGVMVSHRNASNYLSYAASTYARQTVGSVVSLSLAFDAAVTSLFVPLLVGARQILLPDDDRVIQALESLLFEQNEPLLFKLTPAHLDALSRIAVPARTSAVAHVLIVGGEQLTEPAVYALTRVLPHAVVVNEYGPTETTVGCSTRFIDDGYAYSAERRGNVPIGRPIANTRLYVLDSQRNGLPVGVTGELYIGGDSVARGYLNQPELTAERFVADPYSADPQSRLYRSGDLVRWLADGNLEFIGRADAQVKIRGYRIELGEIESVLARAPDVRAAIVLALADADGEKRLVAYVVGKDAPADEPERQRRIATYKQHLQAQLPEHLVPNAYVLLDALPLTQNGKVDRRALPTPEAVLQRNVTSVAPRTGLERHLCELYAKVLKIEMPSIDDDFFALGGHSLALLSLYAELKGLDLDIALGKLHECSTVAKLARYIGELQGRFDFTDEAGLTLIKLNQSRNATKLFLVHPLSGIAAPYKSLAALLEDSCACYGVQAPDNFADVPLRSILARVAFYADEITRLQPHGPYHIAGWSSGGWLAYEVAAEFARRGATIAYVGIIDATPSTDEYQLIASTYYGPIKGLYHTLLPMDWSSLNGLSESAGIDRVLEAARDQDLIPQGTDDEAARAHFRYLCNTASCLNSYQTAATALDVELYISEESAAHERTARPEIAARRMWARFTSGAISEVEVDGMHANLVFEPHVESLAEAIKSRLQMRD